MLRVSQAPHNELTELSIDTVENRIKTVVFSVEKIQVNVNVLFRYAL